MSAASFARAQLLAVRGQGGEALSALDEVLADDPRHLGALLLKAEVLLDAREGEEAIALCRRAVGAWPRSAQAHNALARCLHALGDDAGALESAEEARRLLGEGDNFRHAAPVYLTLVWCLREGRRFKEAVAMAEEGLARVPDAVLAEWAAVVEQELAEAEKERC
jgi:tetratricopeptide (TPR) repeat protein